LGVR
jgi:hypothetical protein